MQLLSSLNDNQREAAVYYEGPSLVIAGAGSGKTRVLTFKIAYMLQQGIKPWNILALTFTNKAAAEMRDRIETLVGHDAAKYLWMGTFHSIFSRILRREADALGMKSDFTIYDAADSRSLIKVIIKEMGLDDKTYKPATIANRISTAKNALVTPDTYRTSSRYQQHDQAARIPRTFEIYERYAARCRMANAMDFDDLLLFTYKLLMENPSICQKYEEQFQYVLVDEYQDTNYAQHQIVWLLTQHNRRICVVGDDAQSIYSFRGANIDNILRFQQTYPGARLFKLERNYRSTQMIVKAANSLIQRNSQQIPKNLYSENLEGEKVTIVHALSDLEESNGVTRRISVMHGRDHVDYSSIAILYRTNSQSRQLEESLRREGIPYVIYGGLSFYQRKEIKDVIAYLRLAVNPNDEEAMRRVINYPARGIGDTTLKKVFERAASIPVSPMEVVTNPASYGLDVNRGTQQKLADFGAMIHDFNRQSLELDAESITRIILGKSQLSATINHGHDPEDLSRQENLQELLDAISAFVVDRNEEGLPANLTDFLQEVSLMSDLDETPDKEASDTPDNHVTLMTIHAAKGLEFDIVFVVGLEESLFPNQMALDEGPRGIEEERRLMYVAMTRASQKLILTSCSNRFRFGKTEMMEPSRFLREIDPQYLNPTSGSAARTTSSSAPSWGSQRTTSPFKGGREALSPFKGGREGLSQESSLPSSVWGKTLKRVTPSPSSTTPPWESQRAATPPSKGGQEGLSQRAATPPSKGGQEGLLSPGTRIEHARFGRGEILSIEGQGIDTKAIVRFDTAGEKKLLLRYAKFTVIS